MDNNGSFACGQQFYRNEENKQNITFVKKINNKHTKHDSVTK